MGLSRLHRTILLFVGVIAFLASVPIVFLKFGRVGLEALSIIATTLLTLGLVILYRQQHRVLRYQELPVLEISDFDMFGDLEMMQVNLSNVGGGPATSLELRIDLYELSGKGPIRTTKGTLRRLEPLGEGMEKKTRSSAIRPSEINIGFEAESRTVLATGSQARNQDSLARIVTEELEEDRSVIYGKVSIEYINKFMDSDEYEADFSLKFTQQDGIEFELFDFRPWSDEGQHPSLGG